MQALHLKAMHAPKFLKYAGMASGYVADGELYVGMQFNDQEAVVRAVRPTTYLDQWIIKCTNQNR